MKCNEHGIERVARVAIGLGLVGWALMGGPVWAWIGIVPLATGAAGFCPAYAIFGISSCKMKDKPPAK